MHDAQTHSNKRRLHTLGLVQIAILKVIDQTPDRAYGTAITDEVAAKVGREFADAQIYVALTRLEDHGLLNSRTDTVPVPSKGRRGRPRKYYALTALGRRALENVGTYFASAWPLMSTRGGDHEGSEEGPLPAPVAS